VDKQKKTAAELEEIGEAADVHKLGVEHLHHRAADGRGRELRRPLVICAVTSGGRAQAAGRFCCSALIQ
jgi:hypothetical protein